MPTGVILGLKLSHFGISFPNERCIYQNKLLRCFGGLVDWGFFEWGKQKTPEPLGLFLYLSFSPSFPLSFLFSSLPFPISSLQEEKRAFSCFPCSDTGKKSKYFYEKHLFSSMIIFLYFTDNPRSLLVPLVGGKHLWIENHSEKWFMQPEEEHNLWQAPAEVWHTQWHITNPLGCASPSLSILGFQPSPPALPWRDSCSHSSWHPWGSPKHTLQTFPVLWCYNQAGWSSFSFHPLQGRGTIFTSFELFLGLSGSQLLLLALKSLSSLWWHHRYISWHLWLFPHCLELS